MPYLRTALFWVNMQEVVVIFSTDVTGQPIGPIFRGQESLDSWILDPKNSCIHDSEDGTDKLSRNVRKKLKLLAA